MRYSTLCGGEIRLEFFAKNGIACASVLVDGDFEDREAAHCDFERMRSVLSGSKQHLAGPGWLCTLDRQENVIGLDLWRDGRPPKQCQISVEQYEQALDKAFGARNHAYAS